MSARLCMLIFIVHIVNRLSVILTRGGAFFVYALDGLPESIQVGGLEVVKDLYINGIF